MFPPIRQRVATMVGLILAGVLCHVAADAAHAADAADGLTLVSAASPASAFLIFLGLTIPVALLAAGIAMLGNPLAGVFAAAGGLGLAAIAGGPIDHWLRSAESTSAFWLLAGESMLWMIMIGSIGASAYAANRWRGGDNARKIRTRPHLQNMASDRSGTVRWGPTLLAGLVAAMSGGMLAWILLQSTDPWHVCGVLGLAFFIGGVLAHQLLPEGHVLAVAISPMLAAIAWYGWAGLQGLDRELLLAAVFERRFVHAALALPVFYASAGVAGAAVGAGLSEVICQAQQEQMASLPAHQSD